MIQQSMLPDGRAPVISTDDILAVFPKFVRDSDSAQVRDAIASALYATFDSYQQFVEYAAAQSNILRATGTYLRQLCADRGVYPQSALETDESLRTRALNSQLVVTPLAILAAVNALLAPFTTKTAKYIEEGRNSFYVYDRTQPIPAYPNTAIYFVGADAYDPHLTGISANIQNKSWAFADTIGRYFVIICPDVSGISVDHAFILDASPSGSFLFNGTGFTAQTSGQATFVFSISQSAADLYQTIVTAVERIKGSSMRWQLYVDPSL